LESLIHSQSAEISQRSDVCFNHIRRSVYMVHFINNAQGGKTAKWMMQFQWKLGQLQLKTWGSSACIRYFPGLRFF